MPTFQFADTLGVGAAQALSGAVRHANVQAESHIRTPENADYEAVVIRWDDEGAHVRSALDDTRRVIPADTLVLATTNVPETTVAAELTEAGFDRPVRLVGDALAARLAAHAVSDGRLTGMLL